MNARFLSFLLASLPGFLFFQANGQPAFEFSQVIPVVTDGDPLPHAWAGGMNFCQYGALDLDLDGTDDLVVFDRSGDRILPFRYMGPAGTTHYRYAPEYRDRFPTLHNWVRFADYDNDGRVDLFVQRSPGIAVYRNTSTPATGLSFTLAVPLLQRSFAGNINTLLASARDLPALADIDEDGDIDLLQFDAGGSQVEYYQNQSIEQYGHADSLVFALVETCWGGFMENSLSNQVLLQVACKQNGAGNPGSGDSTFAQHAGSTLLAVDLDGDLDKELILGDLSFNNLVLLHNGGTPLYAEMIAQDADFPGNPAVNLPVFPAAFSLDFDHDGKQDLLVSPNGVNISENRYSSWWYRNTSSTDSAVFVLETFAALQSHMLDFGEGALPVLHDYDRDGLTDLIVGNYGAYESGNYRTGLARFRNTGTAQAPAFTLQDDDWLKLSSQRDLPAFQYPAFGDLDSDGDEDLILGGEDGRLTYMENTALPNHLPIYGPFFPNWHNIDVGQYATPLIIDLEGDGRLDLLIGEKDGNLNYYRNTGTPQLPDFTLTSTTFGAVEVSSLQFNAGYSVPLVAEWGGARQLIVGAENGRLFHYLGLDGDLSLPFTLADTLFAGVQTGIRAVPTLADLNQNTYPDLIVGNYAGGLGLWMGTPPVPTSVETAATPSFRLYPNPTQGLLQIEQDNVPIPQQVRLYTLQGQLMRETSFTGQLRWDLSAFAPGIYLLKLGAVVQKIELIKGN